MKYYFFRTVPHECEDVYIPLIHCQAQGAGFVQRKLAASAPLIHTITMDTALTSFRLQVRITIRQKHRSPTKNNSLRRFCF